MRRGFLVSSDSTASKPKAASKAGGSGRVVSGTDKKAAAVAQRPVKPTPIPADAPIQKEKLMSESEAEDEVIKRLQSPGGGINIVSLPPSFSDPRDYACLCILYAGTKDKILALPSFPAPYDPSIREDRIEIMDAPGAGRGVFAQRDFEAGELVFRERPLVVAPKLWLKGREVMPRERPLQMAVDNLPELLQAMFYSLHNCKTRKAKDVVGIIETNSLPIGALPGFRYGHLAVHFMLSHINHSCTPNTYHSWDTLSWTSSIHALRPIRAGEQISVTYTDVFAPYAARTKDLERWGFACACDACALPAPERKRSDVRRSVLGSLSSSPESTRAHETEIRAWAADATLPDDQVVRKYMRFAEMAEEERLDEPSAWVAIARPLVKTYCALEDEGNAKKWAKKAMAMSLAASGKDGGWKVVLERPERTEWWGLRMRGFQATVG